MAFFCGISCDPDFDDWQLEFKDSDPAKPLVLRPGKLPMPPQPQHLQDSMTTSKTIKAAFKSLDELSGDSRSTAADETSIGHGDRSESTAPEPNRLSSLGVSCSGDAFGRSQASADWWGQVEADAIPELRQAVHITQLLETRVIKRCSNKQVEIYKEMGLDIADHSSVAVSLHVGATSIAMACRVLDQERMDRCLAMDLLQKRVKLLLNPVIMSLPFPAKGPRDAETVGAFFGQDGSSLTRTTTTAGHDLINIEIDLFSKWLLRMALQNVAFCVGNIVELILVDWAPDEDVEPGMLAMCRLIVTPEFLRLVA
jgi:hypothetical protein